MHTHNSPLMHFPTALKGITQSHLKILEECQDTGPIEALLLYAMQLQDKGGGVGRGAWPQHCHNGGGCFEYWIVSRAAPMS